MPRFFLDSPIPQNVTFELDARAAQHVRVLRLREGEAIVLFNGKGGEVPATLSRIDKRVVEIATGELVNVERENNTRITLYAALIANDRMDWMIQKATELGVATIQPLYSERSQRVPGDVSKRAEHWRGVAIAACEQCGRNQLPSALAPMALSDAISLTAGADNVLLDADGVALPGEGAREAVNVFIGPEGGYSPKELKALRAHCAQKLRIGHTVLRAETAAIAAVALLV
jgi:16S rRNA (uracil1498-N3)-methyltransferase